MSSRLFRVAVLGLALIVICACAVQRSNMAAEAKRKMPGMSKEELLACMGVPNKKAHVEDTEVWLYQSTDKSGSATGYKHKFGTSDWLGNAQHQGYFCDINIVMKNDKVARVHYNGPTSESILTDDEQCGYAIEHCVHND